MIDLVFVTHPDPSSAKRLIERLVLEHWIACGHILPPGTSVFIWEGQCRSEKESTLLLKSVPDHRKDLEREIRREHPYNVPEILFFSVDYGNEDYLAWVRESCSRQPGRA